MESREENSQQKGRAAVSGLVLGIDTCGPSGSVALARICDGVADLCGQKELAGKTYSAMLVSSVGELLRAAEASLDRLRAIVIVNGPGSFTGVRVGVSAVKGLAEGRDYIVVPVSRLEVLAVKASCAAAALDAHRNELFLRLPDEELLVDKEQLSAICSPPRRVAICDEAAATLLQETWPEAELVRVDAPTAADAIAMGAGRIERGVADLALLDGHYLRRSDAEIFGQPGARAQRP